MPTYLSMIDCPNCSSKKIVKNGHIHRGKQRFKCNQCNRQFIENPQKTLIDRQKRELIDRLLLERISLAGIARAAQVSERWLQTYVNDKYATVPREIKVTPNSKSLENHIGAIWYFVHYYNASLSL